MYQKILKLPTVMQWTTKCRSGIYQDISNGTFPKQINLGPRAVGWLESEIQEWIDARIQDRDEGGK
jgi:prophage regulatory protein